MKNSFSDNLNKPIFYPPAILLVIFVLLGILFPEQIASAMAVAIAFVTRELGWVFVLGSAFLVAFCFWAGFSKFGRIRLGGPDAKPIMTKFQWFAVSFTGSVATGVCYWGLAEPLTFYMNPPAMLGFEGESLAAANISLVYSFFHWSIVPFAIYVGAGVCIAFLFYNCKQPFRVSTAFYPLLGEKAYGPMGNAIEAICITSTVAGIGTSLGMSIMQVTAGLDYVFGIGSGIQTIAITMAIMAIIYTGIATTGIHKGIKYVGTVNLYLYLFILFFVFFIGPTRTILENIISSVGIFLVDFVPMVTFLEPFGDTAWTENYTIFYWAWWIAFAPIAGLFMIKLAIGRTIRDFVIINLIGPTLFIFLWFGTLGSAGIASDFLNGTDIGRTMMELGSQVATFELLTHYPMASITVFAALLLTMLSFNNFAEAMAYTISTMTSVGYDESGNAQDPPKSVTVFWGLGIAFFTLTLLVVGGEHAMQALKTSVVICGAPIVIIQVGMAISFIKCMSNVAKYDKVGTFDHPLYKDIAINLETVSEATNESKA